jgi:hypothetical protein
MGMEVKNATNKVLLLGDNVFESGAISIAAIREFKELDA